MCEDNLLRLSVCAFASGLQIWYFVFPVCSCCPSSVLRLGGGAKLPVAPLLTQSKRTRHVRQCSVTRVEKKNTSKNKKGADRRKKTGSTKSNFRDSVYRWFFAVGFLFW